MTTDVRSPFRAGSFYEAQPERCRQHAGKLLAQADLPDDQPAGLAGGLVPHAGWVFSGRLAAMTFKALHQDRPLQTVVLLGADHVGTVRRGEVFPSGRWQTPIGDVEIDDELASAVLRRDDLFRANPSAHSHEHSLEVQVPILKLLAPDARIVPIGVPADALAVQIGQALGEVLAGQDALAVVVGSTDLTHHGGHFGAPGGTGAEGVQWTEANDRRLLERIERMDADGVVPEAREHGNACGPGAIAAAIAACRALGAETGRVLEYTNSYRRLQELHPGGADDTTVGYASVVFH